MGTRSPIVDSGKSIYNIKTVQFEVDFAGTFHVKSLYKRIHDWFEEWNYVSEDLDDKGDPGVGQCENLFYETVNDKGQSQNHIWWRYKKKTNSDFVHYYVKFDHQIMYMSPKEIMQDGDKLKTNDCNIVFRVQGWVIFDPKHKLRSHWLTKIFSERWFMKRWYKDRVDFHKKQLWFEVYNLEDMIKQFLEMKTVHEQADAYHALRGHEKIIGYEEAKRPQN
jgi:hypothetical protein